MQADKITSRILEDANLKATSVLEEAENQAKYILNEADDYSKKQQEQTLKKVEEYKNAVRDKYDILLKIDVKKEELKNKQQILENLKENAVNFLSNLPKQDKIKLLNKLIKKYAEVGDIVLFNINGLTKADILAIKSVKDLNLKVENLTSEEEGVILSIKKCDKNLLFSTLVMSYFEENEKDIIKILF